MRRKAIFVFLFLLISALSMGAATYKTLHNFFYDNGGVNPYAGLTFDQAGNLYGVAAYGVDYTDGMIFKLTGSPGGWNYDVMHEFELYDPAGREPMGGLVIDEANNLYGTNSFSDNPDGNCGTVFKRSQSGSVTALHSFTGPDGCTPLANLSYSNGLLRGTTTGGGSTGQGTVFSIATFGDPITVYSFEGNKGASPLGGVNVWNFGTTNSGGRNGVGNVYRLDPVKGLIGKHNFRLDGQAGYAPKGDLLTGYVGNARAMYGTTSAGGKSSGGTVYRLTEQEANPDHWLLRTLHSFTGPQGRSPLAGVTADAAGNLYGTTSRGGDWDCGTVFKLAPGPNDTWKYSVLYSFNPYNDESGGDGCYPTSGVVLDAAGNLYGTTVAGGWWGTGTVYEILP